MHSHIVPGKGMEEEKMVQREPCACAHSSRKRDGGGKDGPAGTVSAHNTHGLSTLNTHGLALHRVLLGI